MEFDDRTTVPIGLTSTKTLWLDTINNLRRDTNRVFNKIEGSYHTDSNTMSAWVHLLQPVPVNLTVNIQVSDPGTGNLFYHIWFDIESNGFSDDTEIGTGTETLNLDDLPFSPFGSHFTQTIPTKLVVPADFSSFGDIAGTVAYTAMKRV